MRWLTAALLVLVVAIGVAALLQQDPAYVRIGIGAWTIEATLAFALAALVLAFVALHYLLRFTGLILRTPRSWRRGLRGHRAEKARRGLSRGLIEMAEGRWEQAEKLLTRHAAESDTSLLNYLAAARAAQQAGAYERRDRYLKAAIEENPEADVAVSLTQAELQLAHHQTEHSLATLTRLRALAPQHTYVMKLLSRLYDELEDWDRLADLLPELRRRRVLPPERLDELERAAALGRLARARGSTDRLHSIWDLLSRRMREDAEVVHAYVQHLIAAGGHATAERRLRQFLGKRWDETLARDYGLVRLDDAAKQLDHAEVWLRDHGRSPMLLLTLGRLCARNRLWGKARIYLESSVNAMPRAETYYELAQLLDQLGETGAAHEQYRIGLALAVEGEAPPDSGSTARPETGAAARARPSQPTEPALGR